MRVCVCVCVCVCMYVCLYTYIPEAQESLSPLVLRAKFGNFWVKF